MPFCSLHVSKTIVYCETAHSLFIFSEAKELASCIFTADVPTQEECRCSNSGGMADAPTLEEEHRCLLVVWVHMPGMITPLPGE